MLKSTVFLLLSLVGLGLGAALANALVRSYREHRERLRILRAQAKEAEERQINEQLRDFTRPRTPSRSTDRTT